jgi:hypothetical protein
MKLCWTAASERPSAGQILAMLRHLHSSRDQAGDSSERFEQRWALLRPNKAGTLYLPVLEQNPCLDLQDFTPSPSLPDRDMLSYRSPSLQNLRGSLEDLHEARMTSSLPNSTENISTSDWKLEQDSIKIEDVRIEIDDVCAPCHVEIDRELFSYQVSSSLEDEDARKICEAIQDLDDALALEKTSSSSEDSSRESTPRQKHPSKVGSSSSVLDFRLQQVCASDSEEEEATWRGQVERGEFTEKVRQKSRSVQDLMVLTHIDPSSAEQSSDDADAPIPLVSAEPFKSEGNICGAVVIEGLLDSFRQLQKLSKIDDFIQDSFSDQHALVSPQPVISDSLKNKLDFSNIPVTQPEISNSDTTFVSKESQIDEFLSSNTFKYLISEETVPPEININSSDVPIVATDLSNTHDITVDATDLLSEESADLPVNQSRQEIRKTLLLNLNSLDNTQRDSSSCSVTTSTDDSDLTILMNPNLDTPIDTETNNDTEILDMPEDGKKTDGYNADIVEGINTYFSPIEPSMKSDVIDSEQMQTVLQSDICVSSQVCQGKDDNSNPAEFVDTQDITGTLFTIPATETPLLALPTGNHVVAPVDLRDIGDIEISCLQSNSTNNDVSLLESGPESIIQLLPDGDKKTSPQGDSCVIDKANVCAEEQLKVEVELDQRRDSEVSADSEGHSKSVDKFFEPQSVCDKEEAVYIIPELNSEECIETSAKLRVEDEATEVNDKLEVSNLCDSELSVISDVLESVLSAIVNMKDLATNKEFCKDEFVENNNAKVEKCCNVAESIPNLNSNHLLPTTDASKSKVTLGVSDPSSMIAFEPLFPKHHSDYRLRKLKEMNKEYEFSKFKCQEIMKTEPVGMIAFDHAATMKLQNRDVPTLLSPENPEPVASAVLENKMTTGVTPVISEPLLLKPVIEDKSIQSSVKYEIAKNKVPEPLSTIAFEFVSSPPEESNEALLLDADADDAAEIDKLLDVAMEINSEGVVNSLEKLLVVEKLFKPKRLEELCEEALILDVDESHMPKEELSMEAIILDVDSTNLAEEICLENPLLDTSSSLKLDNVGAINRLDNLIRDSVSKENLMLKEKSDPWGSGEFKTKRASELDGMRIVDDIFKRMTPDDERSSDSDFREKTSLSENDEDAGEKYNLEDIEGELETCGQLGTPSSDSGLERTPHDDLKSFDGRGEEDEGDEFWKQQMASLQQAAGKTLALFHEAVGTDLSPCEEEKAYATSWFRRSEEESSPKSSSSTGSGTYGDNTYVSFGIDDESVAAIRNELQQKLPKLERQNSDGDIADVDGEDEELKREDITIHYNIYPAPLSPILEEQESLFASENCSPSDSPGFFLHAQRATSSAARQEVDSLSNSGSSSPQLSPHQSSPQRQSPQTSPKINRSEQFEADIKAALEQCTSAEQRQAEEEEEEEDVLFVNTETNEAKLVESPLRPKLPYLAFVNGQQIYSGAGESDNNQWVEDEESAEKTQAYLEQFDAVTSFSEPDPEDGSGIVSWMAVPITRAPMPSPEEEQAPIVAEPPPCHTPDWESDTASEGSSSSGEFVWKVNAILYFPYVSVLIMLHLCSFTNIFKRYLFCPLQVSNIYCCKF